MGAVCSLRDQAFEPLLADGRNQIVELAVQRWRITNRLRKARQHLGPQHFAALRQRLRAEVSSFEDQQIEGVVENPVSRTVVLQRVERWPAGLIESDQLTVDDGLVAQRCQSHNDEWKACCEVLVIAGPKLNRSAGLDRNRPVAVELQFVFPLRSLRQRAAGEAQHRFDEKKRRSSK